MEREPDDRLDPPPRWSLFLFVLLTALGLVGNYCRYEIFFNIQFIFGSIFAMLVLQFLGLRLGVAAAFLISLITYKFWNHPYAIVIMTAEVLAVGLLQQRRNQGIVLADALYWVFIGIPLVFLFYYGVMDLPLYNATVTMMKQALNGIANALVARLLFMAVVYWGRRGTFSLRELIFNLLALFVLLPSLFMMALMSRADLARTEKNVRISLQLAEQRTAPAVDEWFGMHLNKAEQLAWMSTLQSLAMLQGELEQVHQADKDFLRIGLADASATVIAMSPLLDGPGQNNIGKNFADRPFIPLLKKTLKPMLSEVSMARVGPPMPRVSVVAPVVKNGAYAGYVIGALDLERVRKMLALSIRGASLPDVQFILLDRNNRVIVSSRQGLKAMDPYQRNSGELRDLGEGIFQWLPAKVQNISISDRWKNALYVTELGIGGISQWKLILEQPLAPFQKELYERYGGMLAWVFAVLLAALVIGDLASRSFVQSLEEVREMSTDIPAKIAANEDIVWPVSVVRETNDLVGNFRKMADKLVEQFYDVHLMNAELESRVGKRTRELLESLENYRQLFEAESDAIFLIENNSGRILKANQAACAMYGYEQRDLLAMSNTDLSAEAELTRQVTRETAPAPETVISIPVRLHRKKDGTVFPVEITGRFFVQGGKSVHIAAIRDISRRMEMEQSLRESEERFRNLFESLKVVALVVDPATGAIIDANPAAADFYGWSCEQLRGMNISEINTFSPDELKRAMAEVSAGQRSYIQVQHRLAAGEIRDVEIFSGPVDFAGRKVLYSIIHDITERRRAETEREQFYKFFQTSADLMAIADPNGSFYRVNPAFTEVLGYSEEELVARPFIDFVHPEDKQATLEEMARQLRVGHTLNFENRYVCKDGSLRWLSWRAIFNIGEEITYATARDISVQKEVSEELRRLANEQEVILNTIAVGVVYVKERRLVWSNSAFTRLFGYTLEESATLPARVIYATEEEYERVGREAYPRIDKGEIYRAEGRGVTKDGRIFWVDLYGAAVNPGRPADGSIWILEDISARRQEEDALVELARTLEKRVEEELERRLKNEQMLVQQAKLAAMGEMLGAIAHQWRQPLNTLGLCVQNISEAYTQGELDRSYLDGTVRKSMDQIRHMSKTIDDFRNFFQPDKEKVEFDTMAATGEVLSLFSAQLKACNIVYRLTCHIHERTFAAVEDIVVCPEKVIHGYRNEFEHVLLNLINNAKDAILASREREGEIPAATGLISFDFFNRAGRVVIEVGDDGGGIPEAIMARIFEPYFTSKWPAGGTGIGLYMAKIIIEDHMHGTLTAENGASGAVFRISLPQWEGEDEV